mmetsp:Transcript_2042/g.4699  ORF Transcript_2042/g.4699 Transcript_2042/m.4699 type:complete len:113 (+) Transcript_2042:993-1331(+)
MELGRPFISAMLVGQRVGCSTLVPAAPCARRHERPRLSFAAAADSQTLSPPPPAPYAMNTAAHCTVNTARNTAAHCTINTAAHRDLERPFQLGVTLSWTALKPSPEPLVSPS